MQNDVVVREIVKACSSGYKTTAGDQEGSSTAGTSRSPGRDDKLTEPEINFLSVGVLRGARL